MRVYIYIYIYALRGSGGRTRENASSMLCCVRSCTYTGVCEHL